MAPSTIAHTEQSLVIITAFCVHIFECKRLRRRERQREWASAFIWLVAHVNIAAGWLLCCIARKFKHGEHPQEVVLLIGVESSMMELFFVCVCDLVCSEFEHSRRGGGRTTVAAVWLCFTLLSSNWCALVRGQKLLSDISIACTGQKTPKKKLV